jgi:hypothetical protein
VKKKIHSPRGKNGNPQRKKLQSLRGKIATLKGNRRSEQ